MNPALRFRACALGLTTRGGWMMSTFPLIFVVLWVLGSISSFTIGGLIHLLPAMAIGMMLPRIILGRKVVEY
jgi:hypothetical protein